MPKTSLPDARDSQTARDACSPLYPRGASDVATAAPVMGTGAPVIDMSARLLEERVSVVRMPPSLNRMGMPVRVMRAPMGCTRTPVRRMGTQVTLTGAALALTDPFVPLKGAPIRLKDAFVALTSAPIPPTDTFVPMMGAPIASMDAFIPLTDAPIALTNARARRECKPSPTRAFSLHRRDSPMRALHVLLVTCLAFTTTACGGGSQQRARTGGYKYAPAASEEMAAESGDMPAGGGASSEAATPAYPGYAPASPGAPFLRAPEPGERPGLATEWGETRESRIEDTSFVRATPGRPFAVAEILYNDRGGAEALADYHGESSWQAMPIANGAITVSIHDAVGDPLFGMRIGGRECVVGHEGQRYSIVLSNRSSRRFEAVVTVDGLDVINGRPGSLSHRGYVIAPWQEYEIEGFRQSRDEVAAFRFSKVADSYAAQRGSTRNVGVVGAAFFAEHGDDWTLDDLRTRDTASPFPRDGRYAPAP
jgi:hypothetical protein